MGEQKKDEAGKTDKKTDEAQKEETPKVPFYAPTTPLGLYVFYAVYGMVMGLLIAGVLSTAQGSIFGFTVTLQSICLPLLLLIHGSASYGFGAGKAIASTLVWTDKEEEKTENKRKLKDLEVKLPWYAGRAIQVLFWAVYGGTMGLMTPKVLHATN